MESVPADGKTMGEIMFRGNTVMSGYLKDLEATEEAFHSGWFRSGDLTVKHPDGYMEVKGWSKDIIISGGENISTVEVETVLFSDTAVLEVAVVARPDNHRGQTPCAFLKLKEGFDVDAQEIIKFSRDHLPHYGIICHSIWLLGQSFSKICQELQPERCRNLYRETKQRP